MKEATHPIWPIIRLVVIMVGLTAVLYLTANNFDSTELKTIITMFLIGSGVEGVSAVLARIPRG